MGAARLVAGTTRIVLEECDGVCSLSVESEGRARVLGRIGSLELSERLLEALGAMESRRCLLGPGDDVHHGVCRCHDSGVGVYVAGTEDGRRHFVAVDEEGVELSSWTLSATERVLWRRELRCFGSRR